MKKIKELLNRIWNFFKESGIKIGYFFKYLFVDSPETKEEVLDFDENTIPTSLTKEEISSYSKILHQNNNKAFDKTQNALCFVVIGSILLIIGILFTFLSLEKDTGGYIVGIAYTTLPFYICVICLALGAFTFIYGLIKFFKSYKRKKSYQRLINILGNLKS